MHMFNSGLSLHLKSLLICLVNYKSKNKYILPLLQHMQVRCNNAKKLRTNE